MKVRVQWGDTAVDSRVFDFDVVPRAGEEIIWREGVRTSLGGEGAFEFATRVQYVYHLIDTMTEVTIKLHCSEPMRRTL